MAIYYYFFLDDNPNLEITYLIVGLIPYAHL